jgi:SAM-dependent methyltransferase
VPSDPAAERFLRAFHAGWPGVTREAFAHGLALGDGRSSYELLADQIAVPGPGPILDLGCGDGWLAARLAARGVPGARLVGVDLSHHELAAARARLPEASWIAARAEALPLGDASVAACGSHLAFSLLRDPEPAVRELARVLVPGGRFAIATGGGPAGDDAFAWLLDLLGPVLAAAPAVPRLGDKRTRHPAGLDQLLGPAGFAPVTWSSHVIDLGGPWDRVWRTLSTIYELAHVGADARDDLQRALARRIGALDRVPCTMAIAIATAVLGDPPPGPRATEPSDRR